MRRLIPLMMLSWSAMVAPAFALEATDTMAAWKHASDKDRLNLLEQLLGNREAVSAGVIKCMDETSKTPGHSDLQVGDVAKVCASTRNDEQPV